MMDKQRDESMSAESESSDGRKEKLSEFAELVRAKLKDSFSLKNWEGFVEEVVQWLFHEKDEEEDDIVATACGLMSYGARSKKTLQNIADNKKEFRETLSAKDIPKAICDLLFEKYVAQESKERTGSDEHVGVRELFTQREDDLIHVLDGINFLSPHISRLDKVQELIQARNSFSSSCLVVAFPPASGKTSILALTGAWMEENMKVRVVYYAIDKAFDARALTEDFDKATGINDSRYLGQWILIDDAQNAYKKDFDGFWQYVLKNPKKSKPCVVVATTYDIRTEVSPVAFKSAPRLESLAFTRNEFDELFSSLSRAARSDESYFANWHKFKDQLVYLSDGHVGVFIQGIRMLQLALLNTPKAVGIACEDDAIALLRSDKFFTLLQRCYPSKRELGEKEHKIVVDVLLGSISACDESQNASELIRLKRCGILKSDGSFSSPAAAAYYINYLFPGRALGPPPCTIDVLVMKTVESMSSARFRAAQDSGQFPKEAVFHQMFFLCLAMQIPPTNLIIPEKNTFITDPSGDGTMLSGELDFYIDGDLQWALELVRNGDKIDEHLDRFHAEKGKYRELQPKDYLVIDCRRGPLSPQVRKDPNRCTLYFSIDFSTCTCVMREQEAVEITLKD